MKPKTSWKDIKGFPDVYALTSGESCLLAEVRHIFPLPIIHIDKRPTGPYNTFQGYVNIKLAPKGMRFWIRFDKNMSDNHIGDHANWSFGRWKYNRFFDWRFHLASTDAKTWITFCEDIEKQHGNWEDFLKCFRAVSVSLTKLAVHPQRDEILKIIRSSNGFI